MLDQVVFDNIGGFLQKKALIVIVLFVFERIVLWVVVFGEIFDIFALLLLVWAGGL